MPPKRSKLTARKSTGGRAPRKQVATKYGRISGPPSKSKDKKRDKKDQNQDNKLTATKSARISCPSPAKEDYIEVKLKIKMAEACDKMRKIFGADKMFKDIFGNQDPKDLAQDWVTIRDEDKIKYWNGDYDKDEDEDGNQEIKQEIKGEVKEEIILDSD